MEEACFESGNFGGGARVVACTRVVAGARVVAVARVVAGGKYSFSTAGVGLGVALVVATIFGLTSVGKSKLTTGLSYM